MNKAGLFPIRLKILVTLLAVVTVVVSIITFTMANLFHEDKSAYITDLASIVAQGIAEESRSVLLGYADRLEVYERILAEEMPSHAKERLLRGFFEDFDDLVGVILYEDGEEVSTVFDTKALAVAEITDEQWAAYRKQNATRVTELPADRLHVDNSTISEELPTLTLSLVRPMPDGERVSVISAVIALEGLFHTTTRSGVFDLYLLDAKGELLAHPDPGRVAARERLSVPDALASTAIAQSAGMALRFERDGRKIIGGFAPVGVGQVMAGAEIPNSAVYLASRQLLRRMIVVSMVLLAIAVVLSEVGATRITKPLRRLMQATREIGRGEFDIRVDVSSKDEIGSLGDSFNQMATELENRDSALNEAQHQLIQSEKMAAFGQLGAGIAHEVKNPLTGILGSVQLARRKTSEEDPIYRHLSLIEKETKRCKGIVESLLKFARQEKMAMEPILVEHAVREATAIVHHQLELQKVNLQTSIDTPLPKVLGNLNQLQQVIMNLLINAQQAMEGRPGTVRIETGRRSEAEVEIVVSDDGPGIPEDIRHRIFDPFFTTKPGGRGTGLGLAVSFRIVRDHGGEFLVDSAPGQGTTFRLVLPIADEAAVTPVARAA